MQVVVRASERRSKADRRRIGLVVDLEVVGHCQRVVGPHLHGGEVLAGAPAQQLLSRKLLLALVPFESAPDPLLEALKAGRSSRPRSRRRRRRWPRSRPDLVQPRQSMATTSTAMSAARLGVDHADHAGQRDYPASSARRRAAGCARGRRRAPLPWRAPGRAFRLSGRRCASRRRRAGPRRSRRTGRPASW